MREKRNGCIDIWNSYMCKGARFSINDIPYCPTTAKELPKSIITWDEAKHIYKQSLAHKEKNFFYNAYVCFYIDDYKFDGIKGIWNNGHQALKILRHFAGVITPDFSTYQDFPAPIKFYNTYRMRAFGYWLGTNGLSVINNVRWGTPETYRYCFDGIYTHDWIAIGTTGGSPQRLIDRQRFEEGLYQLNQIIQPEIIIVYGSSSYPCFYNLIEKGAKIISYKSKTASFFERQNLNV